MTRPASKTRWPRRWPEPSSITWERVRRRQRPDGWVVVSAKNVCLEHLRTSARQAGAAPLQDIAAPTGDLAERAALCTTVWDTLGQLSRRQRDVAVLRYLMDCDRSDDRRGARNDRLEGPARRARSPRPPPDARGRHELRRRFGDVMTDEVVLREPSEDETLPSDLDTAACTGMPLTVGGCAASAPAASATTRRSSSSPSLWRFPPLRTGATGIRSRSWTSRDRPVANTSRSVRTVLTKYTGPAITGPEQITLGPDGALWFTNFSGPGSIGRITNAGVLEQSSPTRASRSPPISRLPPRPGVVVHEQQLDRADRHRRRRVGLHRPEDLGSERDRFQGPDGALWFSNYEEQLDRAHHHEGRRCAPTPTPSIWGPRSHHRRTRRRPVVHQLRYARIDRSYHHRRGRHGLSGPGHRVPRRHPPPGPDGALWFTDYVGNTIGRITTSGAMSLYRDNSILRPGRHHIGSRRRAVVHEQRVDRTSHHRGHHHELHGRGSRRPTGHHARVR